MLYGSVCEHQEKKREQSSSRECGIATSKWISLPQQLGFFFFFSATLLLPSPQTYGFTPQTNKRVRIDRLCLGKERRNTPLFHFLFYFR